MKQFLKKNKVILLILLLAVFLNFVGLLPNIRHPDEPPLHETAQNLVLDIVSRGDFDPHTFKYGSLIYYFHALAYAPLILGDYVLYATNILISSSFSSHPLGFAEFFAAGVYQHTLDLLWLGRAVTAAFGVANVFLTYLIGKKFFNKRIGLLAAFLLAIAPLHVRDSHYITTDVPAVFFILLSVLFLTFLVEEGKWRWYVLAGLFIGIASTVRYFPVAIVAYPVAVLLTLKKHNFWFTKAIIGGLAIAAGVFAGVPWLFTKPDGPALFLADLERYSLPWYSTSLSNYVFALVSQTKLPPIATILPAAFRPYLASYVFFNGFGIIPSLVAVAGLIWLLIKHPQKFLLLAAIPLATFVYNTFYLRVMYERVMIPILPFLALATAFFVLTVFKRKKWLVISVLILAMVNLPKSAVASLACSGPSIYEQSEEFINANIPGNVKIAHLPSVSFPATKKYDDIKLVEMFPDKLLFLEEARQAGADYVFMNAARLEYDSYPFFAEDFLPQKALYPNSFLYLSWWEYQSRANLLGKISLPRVCENSRVYYYQLPPAITVEDRTVKPLSLSQQKSFVYEIKPDDFTPKKLVLGSAPVEEAKTYVFSARVKAQERLKEGEPKIFLRIDFEDADKGNFGDFLREAGLFFFEGPTPTYFEKVVPDAPVALSARVLPSATGDSLSLVVKIPVGITKATFSVQADYARPLEFIIDQIEVGELVD